MMRGRIVKIETRHTPPWSVRVMFAQTQMSLEGKASEDWLCGAKSKRERERERVKQTDRKRKKHREGTRRGQRERER